ncbi:MAG: plasmid partition protein ParG [Gammaproteobacteria bacterium]|nr:plasmid partition protein ParG [Gammaproteobacteria bacterium]MDE2654941.1 plasmid partition protein ParG [Gemmatimonadota bacterium]
MANRKAEGMTAGRPSVRKAAQGRGQVQDAADTVRVNFDLAREEHIRLKIHAARTGRSVADILRELVARLDD